VAAGYSDAWFDTFLDDVPAGQTAAELRFLRRVLPDPAFRRVLDVCCGNGRHACGLADAGYEVIGIDRSRRTLRKARSAGSDARFVRADVRDLPVSGPFDAAIIMWQSFGSFDDPTNDLVLRTLHRVLRFGGRLVLDIYDRRFFEPRLGERSFVRNGRRVTERKRMVDGRLHVELRYDDSDAIDRFDWHVYSPDEIIEQAEAAGYSMVLCCAAFDETVPAAAALPRMQVVLAAER